MPFIVHKTNRTQQKKKNSKFLCEHKIEKKNIKIEKLESKSQRNCEVIQIYMCDDVSRII
jgi:hypothetical protein